MKVISYNDTERWLFKEPTKTVFKVSVCVWGAFIGIILLWKNLIKIKNLGKTKNLREIWKNIENKILKKILERFEKLLNLRAF